MKIEIRGLSAPANPLFSAVSQVVHAPRSTIPYADEPQEIQMDFHTVEWAQEAKRMLAQAGFTAEFRPGLAASIFVTAGPPHIMAEQRQWIESTKTVDPRMDLLG